MPAAEGEPHASAAPIIVGGEQNDGPFPERGPRCPLSELRAVTVAAGEPAAGLDGTAAANEHLLVLGGDVDLTVDGVTVMLARGDVDEEIEVDSAPLGSIPDLIRDGRISHSLVIVAFHLLSLRGGEP